MKDSYDIVVIGGGVSGLMSAALFSRFGLSVCLLEMDARPGGYIAGFRRYDYRFDSAIHWLNQCGEKGLVTSAFRMIGTDYPKAKKQHRLRRFLGPEMDYLVTTEVDDFMHDLIAKFPEDEKGIRKFFKDAKRIGRSFDNFTDVNRTMQTMNIFEKMQRSFKMLRFVLPFLPHIRYHGDEGVQKGLSRYFKNPELRAIFGAEMDMLSCLIPISWAHIGDYQTPPEGGSQMFAEWLHHVVESYGNDVLFQSKVQKIVLENGRATGVEFERKGEIHTVQAKYVIAACDVEALYERLLPEGIAQPKMLRNLKSAELYASAFTLSIALDCTSESLGFNEEIIYLARTDISREEQGNGDPATSGIHLLAATVRDKSLAPEGKGTLTVFIPGFIEQFDHWKTEMSAHGEHVRGDQYKELKQKMAHTLIDRIEKKLEIDLRSHIVYLDIATPVTHLRYTGNRGGTMMGARPGKANYQAKVAHYQTPVDNVLLSGHWAELGGGIPVAVRSAINTTLLVLKKENKAAFRLMAKYIDGKIDAQTVDASPLTRPYSNSWVGKLTPARRKAEK